MAILFIFAYNYFEIYETTKYKAPSRQAKTNEYLAMEKWLNKTGHTVRVISSADISTILSAKEKVIIIQANLFDWQQNTYDKLEQWIKEGGNLTICLDSSWNYFEEQGLIQIFDKFGIKENNFSDSGKIEDETTVSESKEKRKNERDIARSKKENAKSDSFPFFDSDISFTINNNSKKIEIIKDKSGIIRILKIPEGNGFITFCGNPVFMKSDNLYKEKNALLSWRLTGEQDKEKQGVLFVRGKKIEPGFFGKLAEQGNFLPLLVSSLLLIAVGFWMVIPVFGRLIEEEQKPGKPIRERFLAEACFLKKYKGLGSYFENYYLAIKQRFRQQYGEIIDNDSFFSHIAEICGLKEQDVKKALQPSGSLTNQEFIKHIYIIESIMERL